MSRRLECRGGPIDGKVVDLVQESIYFDVPISEGGRLRYERYVRMKHSDPSHDYLNYIGESPQRHVHRCP